jgi:hypothetical protein
MTEAVRQSHHWHYDQAVAALRSNQPGGPQPVTACAHMLGAIYRLMQQGPA